MDLVDEYLNFCQDSESPDIFLKWTAIAAISAVAQRKIWIDWGDLRWHPNLYIILVGPPASRKGTAITPMKRILQETGIPISANSITREKFIRRLSESTATVTLANGDYFSHCSFAVWSEELSSFLNKGSEQLIYDLTDLYDCAATWEYDTKHQGSDSIFGTYVTLIAATTPESFRKIIPTEMIGTGFTSRVLFICAKGKRKKSICPSFASSEDGIYSASLIKQRLLDTYSISGKFLGSLDFAKRYVELYQSMPELCPFDPDNFAHYWDRRMQSLMKLSLISALSRGAGLEGEGKILKEEDFVRAYDWLTEAERDMPYVYANFGRHRQADLIGKILSIVAENKSGITYNNLLRRLVRDASAYELKTVVDTLVMARMLTMIAGNGGGVIRCTELIKTN